MATNLTQIGAKARKEPKLVFTSLYHHVYDVDNLRASFHTMKPGKASGIDRVTKESYGCNLEENLEDLSARLRRMGYRPSPKRRSYIPKAGSEKGRPLGISNFEDKIVEQAVRQTIEPIYETMFENSSYGYRPCRSPHQCLDELGRTIQQRKTNHVVEADIRSFFDRVMHDWLVQFLQHRIGDKRIIRLIIRMLKSGILEDGLVRASAEGTPQGSILSPLLSNVYLHYVLDLWFNKKVAKSCRGKAYIFRFADDFLACFQFKDDADRFYRILGERLGKFGLTLAEEKTQCIGFGRYARENAYQRGTKPKEFTFLGFTHYCGKTQKGDFKVKRRTSRKKLIQSLHSFSDWARNQGRRMRKGEMLRSACRRVTGYLNYYAITDNADQCDRFVFNARGILFKWINRKSQRTCYNWKEFLQVLEAVRFPSVRIKHNMCPFRKVEAL